MSVKLDPAGTQSVIIGSTVVPEGELHVEASDKGIVIGRKGDVGDETDPRFKWLIQNAGIDQPELSVWYKDDANAWHKVAGTESTGTRASVREGQGSHIEGFDHDGIYYAAFRINTYPSPRIEFGSNAKSAAGASNRTEDVVYVTTTEAHNFEAGQTVKLASTNGTILAGDKVITGVADGVNFTYSDAGEDEVSSEPMYYSESPSVAFGRAGYRQAGVYVNSEKKMSFYLDSITTEDQIRFVSGGSLECNRIAHSATTPYNLGVQHTLISDSTAGAIVVNLPAASSCKGREYVVHKKVAANTVTLTRAGSDAIEGGTTVVLTAIYDYVKVRSDGVATWWIEGSKVTP